MIKVQELRDELTKLAIEIPENAKKADLIALLLKANNLETGTPHIVTEEDLLANPELVEQQINVGSLIFLPDNEDEQENIVDETPDSTPEQPEEPEQPEQTEQLKQTDANGLVEYKVKNNLKRNGNFYAAGSVVKLDETTASYLLAENVIELLS